MNKWFRFFVLSLVVLLLSACQPTPQHQQPETFAELPEQGETIDTTLYGICGEGTSMHSLELVTSEGDSLNFNYNLDDEPVVRGGLMVGDKLAVISNVDEFGEQRATLILNLTSLLGHWTSIDKNFEIQDGGVVSSNILAETQPWTTWKVLNGQLILERDTFDVIELRADSLYLENKEGIFVYKRQQ